MKTCEVIEAGCPACSYNVSVPFLSAQPQPLATLGWPASADDARAMKRLPADFVCCVQCGHVFNPDFSYAEVPYSEKPNRMFNRGSVWSGFLRDTHKAILSRLPEQPVVVEIGHGDGSFLAALADSLPAGQFIGFDPHGVSSDQAAIEFRPELFVPELHFAELEPDIVISRHVLEHLISPLSFLQRLSFAATSLGRKPLAYFETPCIDRVLETGRTVDFYYEHSSQFSTASFTRMLQSCDADILKIGHGYDREVVFAYVYLGAGRGQLDIAAAAANFHRQSNAALRKIRGQLETLLDAGKSIVVWGGTGKSAAFIGRYALDARRFPVVVDSDPDKAGTYVPGTGQEIRFRDYLLENPADIILIPPQWRARDISYEIAETGIQVEKLLIEHDGRLIDFHEDEHPYA